MRADYTHITFVLDKSGSMVHILTDTIGGFNSFLTAQKEAPGYATMTLREFATTAYAPQYEFKPIGEVPALGPKSYMPGGMTALYDAIGLEIKATGERLSGMPEAMRPARLLFVILTDGQENHSREYTFAQIAAMIEHQTDAYKWEFVYLGANQDAMKIAQGLNIGMGRTMTFAANSIGTESVYKSLGEKVRAYRAGAAGQSFAFDSNDRDAQTIAGVDPALNVVTPKDRPDDTPV